MFDIRWTYVEYVIWNIISYKKKTSMFGTVICLTYFSNSYYLNIFNIRRTIHVLNVCSTYVQYTLPETCVKHALQFSMWMRPEYSFIVVLRAITFYQNLKVYKTVISITYLAVMDENTIKKKYYTTKPSIKCKADMFTMRYIIKVNLWNIIYLGLWGG